MPLKLLVWNIQNFTLNKINAAIGEWCVKQKPDTLQLSFYPYNGVRSKYIIDTVTLADPDIFVLIEVISSQGIKGTPVSGNGAQGLFQLLTLLRAKSDQWCLVPPLKLTDKLNTADIDKGRGADYDLKELLTEGQYTEGIGVFYRKDRVDFEGPYIWPKLPPHVKMPPRGFPPGIGGLEPGPYPDEWQNGLPDGNYYAGQYVYILKNQQDPIQFPGPLSRAPFLTRFVEKGGKNRRITLASVHFPPNSKDAEIALTNLINYFENLGIAQNEVQVIAGDYNIDFRGDKTVLAGALGLSRFTALLGKNSPPSMFLRASMATPTRYQTNQLLDNVAIRCGANAKEGGVNALVINRVNAEGIPSAMWTPMDQILQEPPAVQDTVFRLPLNFGHLGPVPGTSDHLPIFATF